MPTPSWQHSQSFDLPLARLLQHMISMEVSLPFNLMLNQRTLSREALESISTLQYLTLPNQESNHGLLFQQQIVFLSINSFLSKLLKWFIIILRKNLITD